MRLLIWVGSESMSEREPPWHGKTRKKETRGHDPLAGAKDVAKGGTGERPVEKENGAADHGAAGRDGDRGFFLLCPFWRKPRQRGRK